MSVKDLSKVIRPPQSPVETGDDAKWESRQTALGVRLPDDFRDFGNVFGSGLIVDEGKTQISVHQPFSSKYLDTVSMYQSNLEAFKIGEGDDYIPYPIHPERPGLLIWGSDVDGNELYWLTKGTPDKWPVIVRSRSDDGFEEHAGPFTVFLAKVLTRKIDATIWPKPLFTQRAGLHFDPIPVKEPVAAQPTTVYVLYAEYGDQAGFWIRDAGQPTTINIFVKTIDGKVKGKLRGIPTQYERQPVMVDFYFKNQLDQSNVTLLHPHQSVFIKIDPPI